MLRLNSLYVILQDLLLRSSKYLLYPHVSVKRCINWPWWQKPKRRTRTGYRTQPFHYRTCWS
ncbi:hypothetical protein M378DRAFT_160473 [Amanita muscaria Koide BX008]|uniref:Uncharacterized protein n=1 Tax=Amanita muscaria (strain Koide BX008) TaxID=946122 RepID=A0A0C2SU52_AMAMK|nr:hypothetical protein M378DRAFT_160473 [Amanita muscaria Koide BX008]